MRRIEATFRIVTPMFIGDANQKASGIRPPSIKGALRFWWRALNWSKALSSERNPDQALRWLHREEARLFGCATDDSSSSKKASGQGIFILSAQENITDTECPKADFGHQYLLGQGLYHFRDGYQRTALSSGDFKICLLLKPCKDEKLIEEDTSSLLNALKAFGMLGGIGSRSRKGIGSVALKSLNVDFHSHEANKFIPENAEDYWSAINKLIPSDLPEAEPPYSAFSKMSRIILIDSESDAWSSLGHFGKEMMLYRSWGKDGIVVGNNAERNFKEDHDIAHSITNRTNIDKHPERVIFGLPHNYFFSSTRKKVEMSPVHKTLKGWLPDGRERRASPLMVHTHSFESGKAVVVATLLRSLFLPQGERIKMAAPGNNGFSCFAEPSPNWEVLHRFMDRFKECKEWRP